MVLEISEQEMLDRFSDGLRRSADAAKTMSQPNQQPKPVAFSQFIDGLKVAAGSAHQLGIYRENLSMLNLRDLLETVVEATQGVVTHPQYSDSVYWLRIKGFLENMHDKGVKMANAKAMPRSQVLANLEFQQKNPKTIQNEAPVLG